MHAFYSHVPEFLKLYQNISFFNQQGLEKYNDQVSKDYFRSTNHKGSEALLQLMMKKQRIFQLQVMGAERVKKVTSAVIAKKLGIASKIAQLTTLIAVLKSAVHIWKKWMDFSA